MDLTTEQLIIFIVFCVLAFLMLPVLFFSFLYLKSIKKLNVEDEGEFSKESYSVKVIDSTTGKEEVKTPKK